MTNTWNLSILLRCEILLADKALSTFYLVQFIYKDKTNHTMTASPRDYTGIVGMVEYRV